MHLEHLFYSSCNLAVKTYRVLVSNKNMSETSYIPSAMREDLQKLKVYKQVSEQNPGLSGIPYHHVVSEEWENRSR